MPPLFDVRNQVIIVTGAAGLIGKEFVRTLYAENARVVLADINAPALHHLATLMDSERILVCPADISDPESVKRMVESVEHRFGRIDGLVNSAAVDPKFDQEHSDQHTNRFEEYPLALWKQSLDVNLTGAFLCSQAVIPVMLRQKEGRIVNISSTYGLVAPDQRLYRKSNEEEQTRFKPVDYAVTKSAIIGLSKYLAVYYAEAGIRVNTLTLGGVFNNHEPEFFHRYISRTPMARMANANEYGGALVFLLSAASSYMTGANLVADGGWTAW